MKASLRHELRSLLPAWLRCVLLPLPVIIFWRSPDGRAVALGLFFIGCASLVAYAFRNGSKASLPDEVEPSDWACRNRMVAVAGALLCAFAAFSLACLALNDPSDFVAVFLAFSILIPSFCVVPYLTLVTRKPFAAVVLSLSLVGCMKLLGCVVVVIIYGWHASEHGNPRYTDMPWTHPNLLVWLFWLNTGILSLSCCLLTKRRFLRDKKRTFPPEAPPQQPASALLS